MILQVQVINIHDLAAHMLAGWKEFDSLLDGLKMDTGSVGIKKALSRCRSAVWLLGGRRRCWPGSTSALWSSASPATLHPHKLLLASHLDVHI